MKESTIENAVVKYAESLGGEGLKLRIDGRNGYPDRTFKLLNGIEFLIEFKTPNGKLRSAQVKWIKRLRELGNRVYVVDDIDIGKQIVKAESERKHKNVEHLTRNDKRLE